MGEPELGEPPGAGEILDGRDIWARVRARNERVLLELDRIIAGAFERDLTTEESNRGVALCVSLVGTFQELGLVVGIDLVLQLRSAFSESEKGELSAPACSALVEDLRSFLAVTGSEAAPPDPDAPILLVVGPPSRFVDAVLWVACEQGLRVTAVPDADPGALDSGALDSGVVDDVEADCVVYSAAGADPAQAADALRQLAAQYSCPIAVRVTDADLQLRLAVAPHVSTVLVDANPSQVISEVQSLVRRRDVTPALAVFGVDPGPLAARLRRFGITARAFENVAELVEHTGSHIMHAILICADVDLETRLAVPALLRTDPARRALRVISLVDNNDSASVVQLLRAGADEVLPARMPIEVMAAFCWAQLRSAIETGARSSATDRVASLSQRHATLVIERMLVAAYRRHASVSVGVLTFDPSVVDDARFSSFAEPLAREFRRGDVFGKWSGNRYVVALQGVGRRTAVRRFDQLLNNLGVGAGCRVGVAEYPHDGRGLDDLLATAESMISRARLGGGPRVVSADWQAAGAQGPDVLVVDPDATLRALVVTLLERRDMTVVQMNDGVAALEYLTGLRDRALPRVMVMELDLTGLDGLELLRQLLETGVLGRMRILVLTARIRESELLEALELGVSDIVTKPFSPALFVHRLRRVMAA